MKALDKPKHPTGSPSDSTAEQIYWHKSIEGRPLMRYRTQFLEDDVVSLMKSLEFSNKNELCHVVFDHTPIQHEVGIPYNFYIEHKRFGARDRNLDKIWDKTSHIEGTIISGVHATIIEFRLSYGWWDQRLLWLHSLGSLFVVLFLMIQVVPLELLSVATGVLIIIWLTLYSEAHSLEVKTMKSLLHQLNATRLKDEKAKHDDYLKPKEG